MSAAPPRGRVACVQLEPVHGQPDASRAKCDALLDSTPLDGVVLIVLPEMAFTGYLFDAAARVPRDSEQTQRWCVERARRHDCVVVCGAPRHAGNNVYNAQLVARPDGTTTWYDKRHLYDADEAWCTEGANPSRASATPSRTSGSDWASAWISIPTASRARAASWPRSTGTPARRSWRSPSAWCENHPSDPPSVVRRERDVAPAGASGEQSKGGCGGSSRSKSAFLCARTASGGEPLTCLGLGEGDCVFCGASCVLDLATGRVLARCRRPRRGPGRGLAHHRARLVFACVRAALARRCRDASLK